MAKYKAVYILFHKGYPIEDYYQEGNTNAYLTRAEAVGARFEVCGLHGLDNKEVQIVKYLKEVK